MRKTGWGIHDFQSSVGIRDTVDDKPDAALEYDRLSNIWTIDFIQRPSTTYTMSTHLTDTIRVRTFNLNWVG